MLEVVLDFFVSGALESTVKKRELMASRKRQRSSYDRLRERTFSPATPEIAS
jgi:hypothetical protein